MANTSRVNGFRPVRHATGAPYNGQCNIYEVSVSNSIPIYVGDFVIRDPTNASTSGLQTVVSISSHASNANDVASGIIVGAVVGVVNAKLDPVDGKMTTGSISLDTPQSVPVSTKAYVMVADDIGLVFEAQSTAVATMALVGMNADVSTLAVAGNQAVTGSSGMYVAGTTMDATATRPLTFLGFSRRVDNEFAAANNKVLVRITTHFAGNAIAGI
jgi:hypothetical protein